MGSLQLYPPLPPNILRRHEPAAPPAKASHIRCALSKHGQRLLRNLSAAAGDAAAADRLMRKFVASSPKSASLNALSHLLPHPHLSSLALPFYAKIREASWFRWNAKLAADLIASLEKQGLTAESESLAAEAIAKLGLRDRDTALLYCNLLDSLSELRSERGFDTYLSRLKQIVHDSSSAYVKRRGYESMIKGLSKMGRPGEAEGLMDEMRLIGIAVSDFEVRAVMYGYGKLGLFDDMSRNVDKMDAQGFEIDTVCANMVLSSYGNSHDLSRMLSWLRRMKTTAIPFSIRTYNTVSNSCPTISLLLQDSSSLPLSIEELNRALDGEEGMLVKELVDSPVLSEAMEWDPLEAKLDLHRMHLGSAYLIMLQWVEEMQRRLNGGEYVIPAEVTVVCGSGKHSSIRGESPVKQMVKAMLGRLKSPMRIDRRNVGCFVAKGRVLKKWLCADSGGTGE
ncbi:pentatricopeptide repeat-containing protein At2g17033 isoform X2 [Rhodamnia argentea]|uniref:Pentatricopeptide repeat-containing protein At2g17033 isoform X2 n=1 Tax=Rhodamnia argentea TaxID=178133 RepID=A0A8B8NJX9_9MYRT|nr:pentatricopeptide repeat-containing protein At2g17033 isoform X2 [Rhodamnia argentea]